MTCLTSAVAGAQVTAPVMTLTGTPARLSDGIDQVRAVRELSDGTVIVLSTRSKVPLLADYRTGVISDVSREGEGPGEFRQPGFVAPLPNDSTLVADNDRIVILHGAKPVATMQTWWVSAWGPTIAGADDRGRLLELRPSYYSDQSARRYGPQFSDSIAVLRHRRGSVQRGLAASASVDTLAILRGAYRGISVRVSGVYRGKGVEHVLAGVHAASEQAALFLDGWTAIVFAEPYRVDWITPEGRTLKGQPLPFTEVPVDEFRKRAAIRRANPTMPDTFTPDDYPHWPRFLPPFTNEALLAMPDGRLAIRRQIDERDPATIYDFVDRQGRLTGKLRLKVTSSSPASGRARCTSSGRTATTCSGSSATPGRPADSAPLTLNP